MKTSLWTVEFDNGQAVIVSARTVLMAIRNGVWGYNKDSGRPPLKSSNVIKVYHGTDDLP